MITILVEPSNEDSDPDLYVKVNDPEVSQDDSTWKSNNIGSNKIELHPFDPNFVPGVYYIAVHGYKPGDNTFKLTVNQAPVHAIINLSSEWSGVIEKTEFFQFPVLEPGESRIEVNVMPGRGKLAMFVSSTHYYPNRKDHLFSIGITEWDECITE